MQIFANHFKTCYKWQEVKKKELDDWGCPVILPTNTINGSCWERDACGDGMQNIE